MPRHWKLHKFSSFFISKDFSRKTFTINIINNGSSETNVKIPKIGHPKNCCSYPKHWTKWLYHKVMHLKDVDRKSSLIWVYTVCSDGLSKHLGTLQYYCLLTLICSQNLRYLNRIVTKTNKMACAPSKDSDQLGHPPSLIRVFAVRLKKS